MGLNVTVTANEAFADGATVDRAALRRAAKPTVSVTGAISAAEVGDEAISNAKLAHMAANSVKVRDDYAVGDPSDKVVANTQILIGDGTGFTAAALSGDVTMTNAGVVTIAANSVEGPMLHDNTADGVSVERGGSGGTLRVKANGVDITHLADGTAKTVLGYDQDGAAAVIPAGAAGTILTANASTAPTFQVNTGAMKLLAYSQTTFTHTTGSDPDDPIAQIVVPENHGFEDVMIEVDTKGSTGNGTNDENNVWSLTIGPSSESAPTKDNQVKQWRMKADSLTTGSSNGLAPGPFETHVYIGTAPTGTADSARTVVFRVSRLDGAGASTSTYGCEFYGIRIWGLNLGSLNAIADVAAP